jgi:V8-like Glu-specific endopeptidase
MKKENLNDVSDLSPKFVEPNEIISYWNEDRKLSAKPILLPVSNKLSISDFITNEGEPSVGQPLGPDNEKSETFSEARTSLVENIVIDPFRAVGKIFTQNAQGALGTASAFVIGESTIVTAAHCVYSISDGGWLKNLTFVPQYNNGKSIEGDWAISNVQVPLGWRMNESFEYDIAVVILSKPVRPQTGKLAWLANFPQNQSYLGIGYPGGLDETPPADYPFDGQRMWQSQGNYIGGSSIMKVDGNNMTAGCSGGPWTVLRDNIWYANGLNSNRLPEEPNTIRSPYFGDAFINLITWMRENGGD